MVEQAKSQDIIEITDAAVQKIHEIIKSRQRGDLAVRVLLRGRLPGGGFQSEFKFVGLEEAAEEDVIQDTGLFPLYFDPACADSISGAVVDFDEYRYSTGFHIDYPEQIADNPGAVTREWDDPVAAAVQTVIIDEINPGIMAHAGWVALLGVEEDRAFIEMGGGCQGCGLSDVTLKQGIERLIMERVPEIKKVIDTTEHAEGTNPYYAPADYGAEDETDSPLSS